MPRAHLAVTLLTLCLCTASAVSGETWRIVRPTNTGVPGEAVNFARFGPDGRLWVSARWPFFGQGGIGIYDFTTQAWDTYADWDSPIPSQFVNDIEFEPGGAAWIGTSGGLVRFNGIEWTVYTTANAPLLHNGVGDIDLDSEGHVWLNNGQAIFEFDGVNWRSFEVGDELPWELPWDDLTAVHVDGNDHVWVANNVLEGIAEYDGTTWTLHGGSLNRIGSITEDLDGNLWLVAGIGGGNFFYKFDGAGFTTYSPANTPFVNTTITTVAVDDDGAVYVGNWAGQVIRTTNAGASWSTLTVQNQQIYSIAPDPNSTDVWVTTPGAARHLSGAGQWLEAFNTYNTGLPDYFIEAMMADTAGNMWFVSAEAGVSRFDGQRWFNLGSHNPNEAWPVLADGADSIFQDNDGDIWFGSNGVARWDGQSLQLWDWTNSDLGVDAVIAIEQAGDGTMWIGTDYSGVWWFDGSDWNNHSFGIGTANEIEDLAVDANGDLWVASFIAVHRFDGVTWTTWDSLNSPLTLGGLTAIAAHPDGSMWIGTRGGLQRFADGQWTTWTSASSPMPADEVQDIAIRGDGLVAFTTIEFGPVTPFPNGLVLFDGTSWTVHSYESSPLPHYQLGAVAFDAEGNVWTSPISEGVAQLILPGAATPADVDGNGVVDVNDLVEIILGWGPCPAPPAGCPADVDGNGVVDVNDLVAVILGWG